MFGYMHAHGWVLSRAFVDVLLILCCSYVQSTYWYFIDYRGTHACSMERYHSLYFAFLWLENLHEAPIQPCHFTWTISLCLYPPTDPVKADWVKHRKYIGERAFRECSTHYLDWFVPREAIGYLIQHSLVNEEELHAYVHATPRDKALYVRKEAKKRGSHGWHLLYMCIRDSGERAPHPGHQELAKELEKYGEWVWSSKSPWQLASFPSLHKHSKGPGIHCVSYPVTSVVWWCQVPVCESFPECLIPECLIPECLIPNI